ncbi:hypothetical protein TKK_0012261 [Trichogramma kaykai]
MAGPMDLLEEGSVNTPTHTGHHSLDLEEARTGDLCPVCPAAVGDVEHIIFCCPRFTEEREVLHHLFGGTMDTLVGFMLEAESNWMAVSTFAQS